MGGVPGIAMKNYCRAAQLDCRCRLGHKTTIEYLAAKFLQGADSRKAHAIARVETLAGELERTLQILKGAPS